MKHTIYIVDDEPTQLRLNKSILEVRGYQAVPFESPKELLSMTAQGVPSLVLVDLMMPEMSGMELIREIRKLSTTVPIVVLTAESRIEVAIEAIKSGANEFIRKPVVAEELGLVVQKLLEVRNLKETLESIQSGEAQRFSRSSLVGSSAQMKSVRAFVDRVAEYKDATLLLRGESGTGKNHVARVIHYCSDRARARFMDINCASIPDQLLESELFGFERGAFTDARAPKKGLLEAGDRGTVLLDEINAMSPSLQAKLLTVLENHTFRRLGSVDDITVDVRIIATTNVKLDVEVARKAFREDLYYRINVVSVEIPPLRERGDDIALIAQHFIGHFNRQFGKSVEGVSSDALKSFKEHSWPGNIRELRNVIEHAMIFSDEKTLELEDFTLGSMNPRQEQAETDGARICSLEEIEREHIVQILKHTTGDTVRAAAILGISRKTLWEKRKKFGLD